jgi:hypothetical protein
MSDRTTKILLAAIAVGLWANLAYGLLRPISAAAQSQELSSIAFNLSAIYNGTCVNRKIC